MAVCGSSKRPRDEHFFSIEAGSVDARLMGLTMRTHYCNSGGVAVPQAEVKPQADCCRPGVLLRLSKLLQARVMEFHRQFVQPTVTDRSSASELLPEQKPAASEPSR